MDKQKYKFSSISSYLIIFANNMSTLRVTKNNPLAANVHQLLRTGVFQWENKTQNETTEGTKIDAGLCNPRYLLHSSKTNQTKCVFDHQYHKEFATYRVPIKDKVDKFSLQYSTWSLQCKLLPFQSMYSERTPQCDQSVNSWPGRYKWMVVLPQYLQHRKSSTYEYIAKLIKTSS